MNFSNALLQTRLKSKYHDCILNSANTLHFVEFLINWVGKKAEITTPPPPRVVVCPTSERRGGAGRDLLHPGREGHGDRGAHRREGHPGSPPGALGDAPAET